MKIAIESTNTVIEGMGRLWNGVTEAGVVCQVLVIGICSDDNKGREALEAELATLSARGRHEIGSLKIVTPKGEH